MSSSDPSGVGKLSNPQFSKVVEAAHSPWRARMFEIIFESDTRAGKAFDVTLIASILSSMLAVMLESVESIRADHARELYAIEWGFTLLFTAEYFARLVAVHRPRHYAASFFGVVDVMAILPTYLSLVVPGAQTLLVIRSFRLLRIFRVFKLANHLKEAGVLQRALLASRAKITVFLVGVLATVTTVGSLMYLVEGPERGFTSIPISVYWAIVTMTTVGFGDIVPLTVLGKFLASTLMIIGYGLLAVPTGIVSVELARASRTPDPVTTQACPNCSREGHDVDARHCKYCGAELNARK